MIYLSSQAPAPLIEYLAKKDSLTLTGPWPGVDPAIACHADLVYCRLGAGASAPVFAGAPSLLGSPYPKDCRFNAVIAGPYVICRPDVTDPKLMAAAEEYIRKTYRKEPALISVKQGYTRCSLAVIDENHVITADRGIAKALQLQKGPECLLVRPGYVQLSGYQYGFLGGTCGRVGSEIVFSGDLSAHPDFSAICCLIRSCGLTPVWFEGLPLTDIGSIIST